MQLKVNIFTNTMSHQKIQEAVILYTE